MGRDKELIDRLLAEYKSPEEVVGLLRQLTKAIVERALETELTTYLCYFPRREGEHAEWTQQEGAEGRV